jgi:hypothetical protein
MTLERLVAAGSMPSLLIKLHRSLSKDYATVPLLRKPFKTPTLLKFHSMGEPIVGLLTATVVNVMPLVTRKAAVARIAA